MTNKHGVLCSFHIPRDIILFLYRNVPDNWKKKKKKPNLYIITILLKYFMVPTDR